MYKHEHWAIVVKEPIYTSYCITKILHICMYLSKTFSIISNIKIAVYMTL